MGVSLKGRLEWNDLRSMKWMYNNHSEQVSLVRINIAAGFSYKTIITLAWCNTNGTKHWFLGEKSTRQWLCGNSIPLMNNKWNVTMFKRNARPNNNQLITYYLCYLLKNTTISSAVLASNKASYREELY